MTRCAGCDAGIGVHGTHIILRKNYCGRCAEEIEATWLASRETGVFQVRTYAGMTKVRVWILIAVVVLNLIAVWRWLT